MCFELCGPEIHDDPVLQAEADKAFAEWIEREYPDMSGETVFEIEFEEEDDEEESGPEELDEAEADERFQDLLNDIYPTVTIAGYDYDPARVLKDVDPIAYREEFNNWMDNEEREGTLSFPWNK